MAAGRLQPLAAFLAERPPEVRWLALRFSGVEAVLGAALPAIARARRTWWVGDRPWREAGWRVARVDLRAGLVEFERAL